MQDKCENPAEMPDKKGNKGWGRRKETNMRKTHFRLADDDSCVDDWKRELRISEEMSGNGLRRLTEAVEESFHSSPVEDLHMASSLGTRLIPVTSTTSCRIFR